MMQTGRDSIVQYHDFSQLPESDCVINSYPQRYSMTSRRRKKCRATCGSSNHSEVSSSATGNSAQIHEWINTKSLRRIRDHHSAETYMTRQMYNSVLSNEENFVKGIDEFLESNELLNLRKKEILYKKWQENVYLPVRREVENVFERGFEPFHSAKNQAHRDFLKFQDVHKGDVFLDVISADEYDPMTLHAPNSAVAMTAKLPALNDPLHVAEQRWIGEERTRLGCETGRVFTAGEIKKHHLPKHPLVPLGRYDGNAKSWPIMYLKDVACPMRKQKLMNDPGARGRGTFETAWNAQPAGGDVIDAEMQIQKRRRFSVPPTMPNPDLLQHVAANASAE